MLVMKFGGKSVATPESFLKIAKIIIERSLSHKKVIVVVSAMGKTTDELLELAKKIHPEPPAREQDMLISAGERMSIALLAMALARFGKEAVSFTGSQSGIITTQSHGEAKIVDVRPKRVTEALDRGQVAIVAGFQGVSALGEITTLGRGGSDLTAVALGVAFQASCVEFYKDVAGIFDADPKKNPEAKLLSKLTYERALQLAEEGAQVLQTRSIALAQKNGLPLAVHSFFDPTVIGTVVGEASSSCQIQYEVSSCNY